MHEERFKSGFDQWIDVLTTREDKSDLRSDEELLQRATDLRRVVFSQDQDFLEIAHDWHLLSFAHFQRVSISERTRDKMAAARRKGKYVDGAPILGDDVIGTRLVVDESGGRTVRCASRPARIPAVMPRYASITMS